GLVDDYGVDLRGGLQVFPALDQDAVLGGAADTGDDRDRDRDDQGTRAGDDQQGQGQFNVQGDQADGQGGDHDAGGVVLREFLQERLGFCLVILGVFDAVDDLGQGGIRADADRLNAQHTGAQPGAGEDLGVRGLLGRDGFSGDGGLIDPTVSGEHASIDGDLLAVFHEHDVTGGQFPDLNGFGLTVAQHGGGLGGSVHQVGQGLAGAVHRGLLQCLAEGEEEGDGGGFPVVVNEQRADGGDDDQQVNRDHPNAQGLDGGDGDLPAGDHRGGDHKSV